MQQFWNEIMFEVDIKQFVLIQFKVLLTNGTYRSISYVQTTNYKNKDELYETFIEFWNICNEEYHQSPVDKIVFTYKILNKLNSKIRNSKINIHKNQILKSKPTFSFKGKTLPNNMDLLTWGEICEFDDTYTRGVVLKNDSSVLYRIQIFDTYLLVDYMIENNILFTFKDTILDSKKRKSFIFIY
uniref:Uncharacterized protein n=1 Tax=Porodaedalea pini TaxID=108901 RepID=A0A5B9R923_9AGAM|nr:hypothetical protein PPIT_000075 [Porodaedalea pini]QEG56958.1 hypothetical protein PPIT_000075 [Porodaedalea pini]